MKIEPYRRVLALPGTRTLFVVGMLARIPVAAMGVALTLHVVGSLDLGFFRAGLVGAASTLGVAIGSPFAGRLTDRYGLRPVLLVTTAAQLCFWPLAAQLPYAPLLVGALLAGVLAIPVYSLIRQCIAALVPEEQRRTAFSLDSMLVEISYMVGPAFSTAAVAMLGSGWTFTLIGLGTVGAGVAFFVLNPPIRTADELAAADTTVARRTWFTPSLAALLAVTFSATFVLTATELGIIAVLDADGATRWTGLVIGTWCLWSLVGGFVYGGLPRGFPAPVLVGGMAALTLPLALVSDWRLLALALIPSGLLCAPSLSTTVDTMSRWIPAAARGEAMGLHGTAMTLGLSLSSPAAGWIIDAAGSGWAFVLAGGVGLVVALAAGALWRRTPADAVPAARKEAIA